MSADDWGRTSSTHTSQGFFGSNSDPVAAFMHSGWHATDSSEIENYFAAPPFTSRVAPQDVSTPSTLSSSRDTTPDFFSELGQRCMAGSHHAQPPHQWSHKSASGDDFGTPIWPDVEGSSRWSGSAAQKHRSAIPGERANWIGGSTREHCTRGSAAGAPGELMLSNDLLLEQDPSSRDDPGSVRQDQQVPLSVFVGNIPKDITPEMLRRVLQLKGTTTEIVCDYRPEKWLTAFVTYTKYSEVVKTVEFLNNKRAFKNAYHHRLVCCAAPPPPPSLCCGSQSPRKASSHLQPFFPKYSREPSDGGSLRRPNPRFSLLKDGPAGANLFIYGIPSDWTEVTLMRLCQEFGYIVGIRVPGAPTTGSQRLNKGFGFVSYDSTESSLRAVEALSGKQFLGKPLNVQLKLGEQLSSFSPSNSLDSNVSSPRTSPTAASTPRAAGNQMTGDRTPRKLNISLPGRDSRSSTQAAKEKSGGYQREISLGSPRDARRRDWTSAPAPPYSSRSHRPRRDISSEEDCDNTSQPPSITAANFSDNAAARTPCSPENLEAASSIGGNSPHAMLLKSLFHLLSPGASSTTSPEEQQALYRLAELVAQSSEEELHVLCRIFEKNPPPPTQGESPLDQSNFKPLLYQWHKGSSRHRDLFSQPLHDICFTDRESHTTSMTTTTTAAGSFFCAPIEQHLNII